MPPRKSKYFKRLLKMSRGPGTGHVVIACYLSITARLIGGPLATLRLAAGSKSVLRATLILAVIASPLLQSDVSTVRMLYSTGVGEHKHIELPDGSTADLNTDSSVIVYYSADTRLIELLKGEALVNVRHAACPFLVTNGNVLVQDIGTRFDVYAKPTTTLVTVLDGNVDIFVLAGKFSATGDNMSPEPAIPPYGSRGAFRLAGGYQLEIPNEAATPIGPIRRLSPQDLTCYFAWLSGEIRFDGTLISEAAMEFARYNGGVRFVFSDSRLPLLKIRGNLRTTDIEGFERALGFLYGVDSTTATATDGTRIITFSRPHLERASKYH